MPVWLQRDWCSSFVLTMGHFVWQGTLIAVALAIVLRATKAVSVRYWLSLAALLVMAASPVMTLGWLLRPLSHVVTLDATPSVREEPAPSQPMIPAAPAEAASDVGHVSNVPVNPAIGPHDFNTTATLPVPADNQRWWQRFGPQLTTMYLCGVSLMLLRLVFGLWGGRRLRRRVHLIDDPSLLAALRRQATALGLKLLPVLAYCERVTVPTVVGVLKPMILLPLTLTSGLSPEQMESVLAHELAHLRRSDHLVNLLQRVIESLLFFHPALWWVSHRIRDEREHCCDDLVVACGALPLDYAKSLLVVAELSRASPLRRSVAAVSLLATGNQKPSNLRQRIARLLGESATPSMRVSPRVLLLTIAVPLVALIVMIQSGASNPQAQNSGVFEPEATAGNESQNGDRTPPNPEQTTKAAANWGEVIKGLRARVVPVLASMNEDAIDLAQGVTAFHTLGDVAFAVEIENASDNPVSVPELRYGTNYGDSSAKLASDWFGQFLFSIDYFDAAGKRIERPELIPVGKEIGMSDGALKTTLAPKQSLKMLLRPNRWLSVLSQQPMIGKQRAVVKYRGVFADKEIEVIAPAAEFTVQKRGYRPSGIPAAQLGDDPKTDPELEPDITKQLVWGEPVNGVRAALDVLPESRLHAYSHGTKPKITLLVQNVGDKPVSLASLMWLSELPVKAKNAKGDEVAISSTWYTGITPVVRVLLKPQQVVTFDAGNLGLAVTKERVEKFEHVTHRTMVAPSGKYTLQATERFGTSFLLKDGNGKVLVPSDDDIKAELTTGAANLDISNEVIECEIVDAVTGKLVSDTTTSFIIVKPKSGGADEQVVSHMIWGPKSPGRIYFTIPMIPDDIAQRADRDELEVRWGTGNHPEYENYWPAEKIPLKQFFHEGPKSARETLSKIKLMPKKKVAETSPPDGLEFLKPYPKLHGLSLDMTEPQFLEIVKQQELKSRKTGEGEKTAYWIGLGDGLTLIVMFRNDGTCRGIQRIRGEDNSAEQSRAGREEPQTLNGLRTRMTLLTEKPIVGLPLKVKIELENVGAVERTFPWQGANPDYLLEVVGHDGKPAEFINGGSGIPVRATKIKPGETVVLWDDLDVASMFLLPKAGRYEMKLRGPDQFKLDEAKPEQSHPYPTSNTLAVILADGTLNDIQATFVRIRTIAPKVWNIHTRGHSISNIQKAITPRGEFFLLFTKDRQADDQKLGGTMPYEYLGPTRLGHAYLAVNPLAKTEWPDCVEQIRGQLPPADTPTSEWGKELNGLRTRATLLAEKSAVWCEQRCGSADGRTDQFAVGGRRAGRAEF